jgi:hypothetical protein
MQGQNVETMLQGIRNKTAKVGKDIGVLMKDREALTELAATASWNQNQLDCSKNAT